MAASATPLTSAPLSPEPAATGGSNPSKLGPGGLHSLPDQGFSRTLRPGLRRGKEGRLRGGGGGFRRGLPAIIPTVPCAALPRRYATGILTLVILGVGLPARPDSRLETWAHEEALRREAGKN